MDPARSLRIATASALLGLAWFSACRCTHECSQPIDAAARDIQVRAIGIFDEAVLQPGRALVAHLKLEVHAPSPNRPGERVTIERLDFYGSPGHKEKAELLSSQFHLATLPGSGRLPELALSSPGDSASGWLDVPWHATATEYSLFVQGSFSVWGAGGVKSIDAGLPIRFDIKATDRTQWIEGTVVPTGDGDATPQATVVGSFYPTQRMAMFDVTVKPRPPVGTTSMNVEVRSGPANPPTNYIGGATGCPPSFWHALLNSGYNSELTYYVTVKITYFPDASVVEETKTFSGMRAGVPITGN